MSVYMCLRCGHGRHLGVGGKSCRLNSAPDFEDMDAHLVSFNLAGVWADSYRWASRILLGKKVGPLFTANNQCFGYCWFGLIKSSNVPCAVAL